MLSKGPPLDGHAFRKKVDCLEKGGDDVISTYVKSMSCCPIVTYRRVGES